MMSDVKGAESWTSPSGTEITAVFLAPQPITKDNLSLVVRSGLDFTGVFVPRR